MPLRYDVVLRGCLSLFIDDIFTILISMLLLLSFLMQRKKKGRGLALIAAAPQTIIFIVCDVIMMEMFTFDFDGATLFIINHTLCDFLLPVAGYLLLGLSMEPRIATNNALSGETVSVAPNASGVNTIEKLTRLKALLDAGAITQEEFDAKKKQLLGL
ncbi:MAG: SHOCT domain-containing protein [Oscillospiraceae bacterium]|nr:SHOCT domain-containing protein [Oscillospiraceae bacterium]